MVGLIYSGNKTVYRAEVVRLSSWCSNNILSLSVQQTKELILDFRKHRPTHTPPPH